MSLSVALPALHAAALTTGAGAATTNGNSSGGTAALSPTFGVGGESLPSPTSDRVEWSRSTILDFIEDYRMHRVLWDPNTKGYHIKQTKYEALKLLGNKYGTEIRSIRSKIKSLRSSFHREHGKVMIGRQKGVHYQPMWFAYDAIRFILDGEGGNGGGAAVRGQHAQTSAIGVEGEADEVEEKLALLRDDSVDDGGGGGGDDGADGARTESGEMDDKYATTMEAAVRAIQAAALAGARESGGGGAVTSGANAAAVAGTTVDELKVEPQATNVTAAASAVNATKTTATTVVYGMKTAVNSQLFNASCVAQATPTTTTTNVKANISYAISNYIHICIHMYFG
uniref:MADF domain-containing protein n=1 Tax=Zeugodacus cucurbitae TaxID=28588 RepID=A0A0A1XD09_ZEUCU